MTRAPGRAPARTVLAGLLAGVLAPLLAPVLAPVLVAPAGAADSTPPPECDLSRTYYEPNRSPALVNLAVPQTWPIATGKGVTVAVVDSGINVENAHFPPGSVRPGISLVPGDDSQGLEDRIGHGTAVAGILAGRLRQDLGSAMVGVARDATILPVRVYTADGPDAQPGDTQVQGALVAEGIRRAVLAGADVVNVSLSVTPNNVELPEMIAALELARRRGVVVVAAAGNAAGEPVTRLLYPAAGPDVIGVSALNAEGRVDDFSVHGEHVDVAAPGAGVLLAFHGVGDCTSQTDVPATSWATPFVAGLAAQLRERFPDASVEEITYRITSTALRPVAGQRDDDQGWGRIQPYEALTATIDERRPGPAAPDSVQEQAPLQATGAEPVPVATDALAPARRQVLWWSIGGAGLAALALVLRPLVRRGRGADPTA